MIEEHWHNACISYGICLKGWVEGATLSDPECRSEEGFDLLLVMHL